MYNEIDNLRCKLSDKAWIIPGWKTLFYMMLLIYGGYLAKMQKSKEIKHVPCPSEIYLKQFNKLVKGHLSWGSH